MSSADDSTKLSRVFWTVDIQMHGVICQHLYRRNSSKTKEFSTWEWLSSDVKKKISKYFALSSFYICLFLFFLRHLSASGIIKIGGTKMQREKKNQCSSCDKVFGARARWSWTWSGFQRNFSRLFYAFINMSRIRLDILHRVFTMKLRIKVKQDLIKGNFLLSEAGKVQPYRTQWKTAKNWKFELVKYKVILIYPLPQQNDSCSKGWNLKDESLEAETSK